MKTTHNSMAAIKALGGVNVVADKLGASYQRVNNWIKRGIPKSVLWDNKEFFAPVERLINEAPSE